MIQTIKLNSNGYTVRYEDKNISYVGDINKSTIEDVVEWLKTNTPEPEFTDEELQAITDAELKASIAEQLANLTITTSNGNTFDGNDQARLNMSNAIISADVLGMTETTWRMADNSDVVIGLAELKEALALSIQEFARVKNIGV